MSEQIIVPEYRGMAPMAPGPVAPGLTPAQMNEIALAQARSKKIRRAMSVATVDAWLSACFAGMALLSGIMSLVALVLGALLAVVAWNSFRGAGRLRRMDATAPRLLMWNQCFLAGVIVVYAGYSLYTGLTGKSELETELAMVDAGSAAWAGDLERMVRWIIFGALVVGTLLAQGLAALYYGTRGRILKTYLQETPAWVVELQRVQAR